MMSEQSKHGGHDGARANVAQHMLNHAFAYLLFFSNPSSVRRGWLYLFMYPEVLTNQKQILEKMKLSKKYLTKFYMDLKAGIKKSY